MARGRKIEFKLGRIWIEFNCNKCEKWHKVEVDVNDFSHWEAECELCGSHGGLSVDVKCPGCGYTREIELRSW
jgi:Zn finger protein HypA/HybF involved in hydrogenase expression